eukprot:s268_g36.t1
MACPGTMIATLSRLFSRCELQAQRRPRRKAAAAVPQAQESQKAGPFIRFVAPGCVPVAYRGTTLPPRIVYRTVPSAIRAVPSATPPLRPQAPIRYQVQVPAPPAPPVAPRAPGEAMSCFRADSETGCAPQQPEIPLGPQGENGPVVVPEVPEIQVAGSAWGTVPERPEGDATDGGGGGTSVPDIVEGIEGRWASLLGDFEEAMVKLIDRAKEQQRARAEELQCQRPLATVAEAPEESDSECVDG